MLACTTRRHRALLGAFQERQNVSAAFYGSSIGLWGRQCARGFEPGQPGSFGPKYKWVGCLQKTTEGLKGRHRLQINGNFFSVACRRTTVNNLDVQTRQTRGRRTTVNNLDVQTRQTRGRP